MSTITRGTKAGTGTTDFGSGTTILASEVNADLNVIVNEINGGLTDANVSGSANVDLTKLADYSASATEQATTASPGTAGSESLATNLLGELTRLRYAVARLTGHLNAQREAGAGLVAVPWIEPPFLGENLVRNASFATASSGTPLPSGLPDGWVNVSGGAATSTLADADTAFGLGLKWVVTATAVGDGVAYTLSELRASTKYLLVVRASVTGAGEVEISTTGADATSQYRNPTKALSGASQANYALVVQTDSTPTDIVLRLLNTHVAGSQFVVTHVGCYELGSEPLGQASMHSLQTTLETGTVDLTAAAGFATIVTAEAYVPPGHVAKIYADGQTSSLDTTATLTLQITDDAGATLSQVIVCDFTATGIDEFFAITRVDYGPTTGAFNTYTLEGSCTGHNVRVENITMHIEVIPLR